VQKKPSGASTCAKYAKFYLKYVGLFILEYNCHNIARGNGELSFEMAKFMVREVQNEEHPEPAISMWKQCN
jgi:hypothetical protein